MGKQIWRFQVREGLEDDFVSMNQNDWPVLFSRSDEYKGTIVGKNTTDPRVYLTMDEWTSKDAFDRFVAANRSDFDKLSERHKRLCDSITNIGFYDFQ